MHNLTLCRGDERLATLSEDLHVVLAQTTASQIKAKHGVWQGEVQPAMRECIHESMAWRTSETIKTNDGELKKKQK